MTDHERRAPHPLRAPGDGLPRATPPRPGLVGREQGRGVPIELHPSLEGRFAELAAGRILVIDYLVTRPAPAVPTAELSARLQRSSPRGSVVVGRIEGVDCVADPRLEGVLREAGPRIRPVAGAVLGQLEVDLARPMAWLDFLSSTAARRP